MRLLQETDREFVTELLKPRPRDMHKGQCGRVLIIAGSPGMAGAAVLSAKAALRSGAGLVSVALPSCLFQILQTAVPEATCVDSGGLLRMDLDRYDAIAAGPGLGVSEDQYRILEHILLNYRGPVIVDADGINNLCRSGRATEHGSAAKSCILPDITAGREAPVILTPHPGEADRLLQSLGEDTCAALGRESSAETLARESGAIVVLKGPETLVAVPGRTDENDKINIYVNKTGNPGMATGGSGDVLTGVTAALTAFGKASLSAGMTGFTPEEAVRCAVYIHGSAGDLAASEYGEISMTSMDIVSALPRAFRELSGRQQI